MCLDTVIVDIDTVIVDLDTLMTVVVVLDDRLFDWKHTLMVDMAEAEVVVVGHVNVVDSILVVVSHKNMLVHQPFLVFALSIYILHV